MILLHFLKLFLLILILLLFSAVLTVVFLSGLFGHEDKDHASGAHSGRCRHRRVHQITGKHASSRP